jgi:uncharacterized protein YndB with AHSA1/START domain
MIGRLFRLAAAGVVAAFVIDRILATRRGSEPPPPIRSMVAIDAPIERVWAELADIEGQPRWMTEMKAVRITTPGPVGVGTRGEADVRILGIGVSDPVEIVAFEPPHRFAIRHEGVFTGGGVIELQPGSDGRSTIVMWDETLVPPILPELGALVGRPILGAIFQADLHRFRELLETPPPGPAAALDAAPPA